MLYTWNYMLYVNYTSKRGKEETADISLSVCVSVPAHRRGHVRTCLQAGREPWPEINPAGTLILDFHLPELRENKSLVFKSPNLQYFVMATQAAQYLFLPSSTIISHCKHPQLPWPDHLVGKTQTLLKPSSPSYSTSASTLPNMAEEKQLCWLDYLKFMTFISSGHLTS